MTAIHWGYILWGRMWESMFSKFCLWQIRLENRKIQSQTKRTCLKLFKIRVMTEQDSQEKWKTVLSDLKCRVFLSLRQFTTRFTKADNRFQKANRGGNRGSWKRRKEPNGWIREGRRTENINMYCTISSWKMCQQIPGQLQLASDWPSSFG